MFPGFVFLCPTKSFLRICYEDNVKDYEELILFPGWAATFSGGLYCAGFVPVGWKSERVSGWYQDAFGTGGNTQTREAYR